MRNHAHDLTLLMAGAFALGGAVSCSGTADGSGSPDDPAPAVAAESNNPFARLGDSPDPKVLARLGHGDVNDLIGSEKIRNGATFNYNDRYANGVVLIFLVLPDMIHVRSCTAQIVNKYFLLTAGHCLDGGAISNFQGSGGIEFVLRDGSTAIIYSGPVRGAKPADWRVDDLDVGLVYVPGGIPTCQGTLDECATNQPDVPVNPVFQYFRPGLGLATQSSYAMAGYGTTDGTSGAGVLRGGFLSTRGAGFTTGRGFEFFMEWTDDSQARPCPVDSGSPFIPLLGTRALQTGIASQIFADGGCVASAGTVSYTGITEDFTGWLFWNILGVEAQENLGFHCTSATSGNLSMFACDNDGSVF